MFQKVDGKNVGISNIEVFSVDNVYLYQSLLVSRSCAFLPNLTEVKEDAIKSLIYHMASGLR